MLRRLRRLLRLANLSEEEVTVYLWLLKLRRCTIPQLREQSGLPNITVYRILHALEERGLVSTTPLNDKQSVFAPLGLRALARTMEREQLRFRKLQLALQNLEPLFPYIDAETSEESSMEDPIEVREGDDAFLETYLGIPDQCGEDCLLLGSLQNLWHITHLHDQAPQELTFRHRRMRKNTFARLLTTPSPEIDVMANRDSLEKRTTQIVKSIPLRRDCIIFGASNLYHFICEKEYPRVLIVRHPDLLAAHRHHFDLLWKQG